jgi:hypothetical protein
MLRSIALGIPNGDEATLLRFGIDSSSSGRCLEHHGERRFLRSVFAPSQNRRELKFAPTKTWSTNEQKSVASASEKTIVALRDENIAYEERYGFIFIVCATGKSAEEMLEILNSRMNHTCDDEIQIAAKEQAKITRLRLEKLEL